MSEIVSVRFVRSNTLPPEVRRAYDLPDNCMVEVTVTNSIPKVQYKKVNSVMETIREEIRKDQMLGTKLD